MKDLYIYYQVKEEHARALEAGSVPCRQNWLPRPAWRRN